MSGFLPDTNILSAHLRGDANVWNRFVQHAGRPHISTVTVGEFLTLAHRTKATRRTIDGVHETLAHLTAIDVDSPIAARFAEVRGALLDLGNPIDTPDLLIAATALEHGLTMVTANRRHFDPVPGLTVVDWSMP